MRKVKSMIKVNDEHLGRKIDYASYEEQVAEINKMIDAMWEDLTITTELLKYSDKIKDSKRKS